MPSCRGCSSSSSSVDRLASRIGPVGQQREVRSRRRAGEVMDFEPLDLLVDRPARVSSVGTTTRVRRSAGTPSRSSRPGSSVAPKPPVTARLTSATAASIAGSSAERAPARQSQSVDAAASPGRAAAASSTTPAISRDRADIAGDADRCVNRRRSARPAVRKPIDCSNARAAVADQIIAGIAIAPIAVARLRARPRRRPERAGRPRVSAEPGAARQLLDGGAIEVAGREIHLARSRCRRAARRRPG